MELETIFGTANVSKGAKTRSISVKIGLKGQLKIVCPKGTPNLFIKNFIKQNQSKIKPLLEDYQKKYFYKDGDLISKTVKLKVEINPNITNFKIKIRPNFLVLEINKSKLLTQSEIQQALKNEIKKIVKKDAKMLLKPRIENLAKKYGFEYKKLNFTHSATRWGSCSSNKTISLNITLVRLSDELINQVIIHELSHLKHMNHSREFWQEVAKYSPNYKILEQKLKQYSPHI